MTQAETPEDVTIQRKDLPNRIKNPFPNAEHIWTSSSNPFLAAQRRGRAWCIRGEKPRRMFKHQMEVFDYINQETGCVEFSIKDFPDDPNYVRPSYLNPEPMAETIMVFAHEDEKRCIGSATKEAEWWVAGIHGEPTKTVEKGYPVYTYPVLSPRRFRTQNGVIRWFEKIHPGCTMHVHFPADGWTWKQGQSHTFIY